MRPKKTNSSSTNKKKQTPATPAEGIHEAERRKRDKLTKGIIYHLDGDVQKHIHALLDQYLEAHNKRRTIERYMVLDEIYGVNKPLDIETLMAMINEDQGIVCQSSVYNILPLLVEAGLVRKIDLLQGNRAFYEKVIGEEPHGYAVCCRCGTIKRLDITGILPVVHEQLTRAFQVKDSLLVIQGECARCRRKKGTK